MRYLVIMCALLVLATSARAEEKPVDETAVLRLRALDAESKMFEQMAVRLQAEAVLAQMRHAEKRRELDAALVAAGAAAGVDPRQWEIDVNARVWRKRLERDK